MSELPVVLEIAAGGSKEEGVPSDDVHCVVTDEDAAVPDGEWYNVPLDWLMEDEAGVVGELAGSNTGGPLGIQSGGN